MRVKHKDSRKKDLNMSMSLSHWQKEYYPHTAKRLLEGVRQISVYAAFWHNCLILCSCLLL